MTRLDPTLNDYDNIEGIPTEAGAGAALGLAAAAPVSVEAGDIVSITASAGGANSIVDLERYLPNPRRAKGAVEVWTAGSFIDYVTRHMTPATELYVDSLSSTMTAVLNSNEPQSDDAAAGWGDYRSTLVLRHTPEWLRWFGQSGNMLNQETFAEFIEDGLAEIVDPDAATMLELAQTFQARNGVDFESSTLLDNGQRRLTYKETTTATAGATGTIEVPKELVLGIRPYEGGEAYRVTCRFRYRLTGPKLSLGFIISRPEDVLKAAFGDVLEEVVAALPLTALAGKPAAART